MSVGSLQVGEGLAGRYRRQTQDGRSCGACQASVTLETNYKPVLNLNPDSLHFMPRLLFFMPAGRASNP